MSLTKRENMTKPVSTVTNFGAFDGRGREIGCSVMTYEIDFVPVDAGETFGYCYAAGHYFVADVQATRSGTRYGACQHDRHFTTAAERDAYVAKRVADSRKAAARKAVQP